MARGSRGGLKSITVDSTKRLADEPGKGHNRCHEAIAPIIEAAPGEQVEIQTRDAFDGQIRQRGFAHGFVQSAARLGNAITPPLEGFQTPDLKEARALLAELQ